jgi:hypothetical protein
MAAARVANVAEKVTRHKQSPITTGVSNYSQDDHGDSAQKMKALTWQGKFKVKLGELVAHDHKTVPT